MSRLKIVVDENIGSRDSSGWTGNRFRRKICQNLGMHLQRLSRMIGEVLASTVGWMEVTFTNRVNPGRGPGVWTTWQN